MSRTLEQKIAEAEARLQRLKAKSRSLDTAQKVVVGAALLAKVRKPEEVQLRAWLLQFLKAEVTRHAGEGTEAGRGATACVPAPVSAKGSHKTGGCEPTTTAD